MNALKHEQDTGASMSLTTVEGWSIAMVEDEPRVRDLDLAERLGYGRSRDIRELVKRYEKSGDLSAVDVSRTVRRTQVGVAERDVTEFWLSEAAALFIVTKSETANAIALTKEMIRVFMLVRRGTMQPAIDVGALVAEMQAMRVELAATNARMAMWQMDSGVIGPDRAERYLSRIRLIALAWVAQGKALSTRAGGAAIRQHLAAILGFGGTGKAWQRFPIYRVSELEVALASLERDAQRVPEIRRLKARAESRGEQQPLPWTVN